MNGAQVSSPAAGSSVVFAALFSFWTGPLSFWDMDNAAGRGKARFRAFAVEQGY